MDALIFIMYVLLAMYLIFRYRQLENYHTNEIERVENINDNLRLHIHELEKDIDRLCAENRKLREKV